MATTPVDSQGQHGTTVGGAGAAPMIYQPRLSPAHRLSLFVPEDSPDTDNGPSPISPRMSLSEFYRSWFVPIVLSAERDCTENTHKLYANAIDWWVKLTGDPPLSQIDEFTLALFQEGLRKGTYRRGRFGKEHPLTKESQHKHLRNIRAVLHRTGPTRDANRPSKGVLAEAPHLRLPTVKSKLKPCFTLAQAQAIMAAAVEAKSPSIHKTGVPPYYWWRCRLAMHLYTGLRSGTIRRLTWQVVEQADDGHWWLNIPEHLVTKTQKETRIIVHPLLFLAMQDCRRSSVTSEPISFQPHGDRWIQSLHDGLQKRAGIPEAKWLSPHAWRRMHGDQLAKLGMASIEELCRSALDHSDARTTTGHYVDVLNQFRLRLPALW
jgi:integrase